MTDQLEELRHELADVEQGLVDVAAHAGAGADQDRVRQVRDELSARGDELRREILALERAVREEMGVQPAVDGTVEEVAESVAESRPSAMDLIVPPTAPGPERDTATLIVLDRHDEDQVLAQIEERMDRVLMYDFRKGSSQVTDLSVNGVFECIRLLNATGHARIGIVEGSLSVAIEPGDDGPEYVVDVAARDEVSGLTLYASATEPRMMRTNNGPKKDPFARQKAISKAQRNALKRHIPERLRQGMLALHKGDNARVLEIQHGAGAAAVAELPPPLATPEATALEGEIKAIWGEVRKQPGWQEKMLPGVFGAKLSRARSSLVELEALRDALQSLLALLQDAARVA